MKIYWMPTSYVKIPITWCHNISRMIDLRNCVIFDGQGLCHTVANNPSPSVRARRQSYFEGIRFWQHVESRIPWRQPGSSHSCLCRKTWSWLFGQNSESIPKSGRYACWTHLWVFSSLILATPWTRLLDVCKRQGGNYNFVIMRKSILSNYTIIFICRWSSGSISLSRNFSVSIQIYATLA